MLITIFKGAIALVFGALVTSDAGLGFGLFFGALLWAGLSGV